MNNNITVEELKSELDRPGVPRNFYSINVYLSADTYMLNQVYTYWEYFYFDERGNTRDYRKLEGEEDACEYFFGVLEIEKKYYHTSKGEE